MRKNQFGAMTFTCDHCGTKYSTKSNLNRHQQYSKTCGKKKYECEFCMTLPCLLRFQTKSGIVHWEESVSLDFT